MSKAARSKKSSGVNTPASSPPNEPDTHSQSMSTASQAELLDMLSKQFDSMRTGLLKE